MKKKEIKFDLTALLDITLILLFSILLLNAGQMVDFKSQLEESEEQRARIEEEKDEAERAYDEISDRLAALSDWDTERLELTEERNALDGWKTAVEESFNTISIDVQSEDGRRIINIEPKLGQAKKIEMIWAVDSSNVIINERYVLGELDTILSDVVETQSRLNEQPMLIMFNYGEIRNKEFILIYNGIQSFIDAKPDINIYYSLYNGHGKMY